MRRFCSSIAESGQWAFLSVYEIPASTSADSFGYMLGPPTFVVFSTPLTLRIESRTSSDDSRRMFDRHR